MGRTSRLARRALSVVLTACFGVAAASDAIATRRYVTWYPWQADSVLAAWALKRHVSAAAEFESAPNGAPVPADQALDIPESVYRRNGLRTAYEEVLRVHRVDSPCTERLRPIVRVLELASWRKAEHPEAENFEAGLLPLLPRQPGKGGLAAAFAYVDQFCSTKGATPR